MSCRRKRCGDLVGRHLYSLRHSICSRRRRTSGDRTTIEGNQTMDSMLPWASFVYRLRRTTRGSVHRQDLLAFRAGQDLRGRKERGSAVTGHRWHRSDGRKKPCREVGEYSHPIVRQELRKEGRCPQEIALSAGQCDPLFPRRSAIDLGPPDHVDYRISGGAITKTVRLHVIVGAVDHGRAKRQQGSASK